MKKFLLILIPFIGFSQNKTAAEEKVNEGITLHDAGKFSEALKKYNEALILDKDNLLALTEKSMTLEASKNYDEAIKICQFIITKFKNDDIRTVYLNYGNSLDHSKKPQEAIKVYDEGLKKYPDYYQLYFNKGITLVNLEEMDKSLESFQRSIQLNPNHPGTLNALAVLNQDKRAISILCSLRYLSVDNESKRAQGNLELLNKQIYKGVSQKDDKNITLTVDPKTLEKSKKEPDDFSSIELILPLAAALDFDDKNKNKTDTQKLKDKIDVIASALKESQKGKKGFYREFFAPYFIEMKEKNLTEPFAYIAFLTKQTDDVVKYHKENSAEIERFYQWSENYQWK